MACEEFEGRILEYLEGALSEEERHSVDRHVAGCPECGLFSEQQKSLDDTLSAALTPPTLSPYFRQRVLRRIVLEAQPETAPLWPELLDLLGYTGVAIAGAFLLGRLVAYLPELSPQASVVVGWTVAGISWLTAFALALKDTSPYWSSGKKLPDISKGKSSY